MSALVPTDIDQIDPGEAQEALRRHHEAIALRAIEKACGATPESMQVCTEDRLRGAITEALFYLDKNSPPQAHAVLRRALKIK